MIIFCPGNFFRDMDGVEDISDEDDEHDAIDEEPDNHVDGDACVSNGRLK